MIKEGDKVQTNDAYFKQHGRRVIGRVLEQTHLPSMDIHMSAVKVTEQTGKVVPAYYIGQVMMRTIDLEKYEE